jgi:hypothetical protein
MSVRILIGLVVAGLARIAAGAAVYEEEWNASGNGAHRWNYWTTGDVAMAWQATGGRADSGHVSAPLAACSNWLNDSRWPAYTFADRDATQNIDLVSGSALSVYARMADPATLNGGSLHFFIGEWLSQSNYVFYQHNAVVTVATNDWSVRSSWTAGTDLDWTLVDRAGSTKNPTDLYANPQQYGFVIRGSAGQPTGSLGLDSFAVIPEPATLALAAGGAMLFAVYRRRRRA